MAIQVRHSGAWVDNTQEKKRVNGSWVSNEPYKVMKPYISGVPPFTFKSDGQNLRDWSMSGQTGGVGDVTDNWIDADTVYSAYKQADGTFQGTVNNFYTTHPKPFTADDIGKTFTFAIKVNLISSNNIRASANVGGTNINGNNISSPAVTKVTFTVASVNDYLYVGYGSGGGNQINISDIMLNEGSQPIPYEPYGKYKIPIACGGTTTSIIIDSKLMDGDTISKTSTGVNIPTVSGSNTLTVGTTVQPSSMSIESISQWV